MPGRPMRVLAIDPGSVTPYFDHGLCRALGGVGCDVELITAPFLYAALPEPEGYRRRFGFWRLLRAPGAGALRHTRGPRRLLKACEYPLDWLLLSRRLASPGRRPDVLHLLWSIDPLFDAWWLNRLRQGGLPSVLTVHNAGPHQGEPTRRRGLRRLYGAADAIVALSRATERRLISEFGVAADKIRVIAMGQDVERSAPPPERAAARRRLGLPAEAPVALFFGLIKPYKGLDVLIRAFQRVRRQIPHARLVIAGLPKMPFAPLAELIRKLDLERSVITDPRYLPAGDAELYFAAADTVVLPYRATSQSGVLLMAYAAGRPVVASETGGLGEMIEANGSGILVPPGDETALAEAVAALLSDPRRARAMGERARVLVAQKHAWPAIAASTLELYDSLAATASRPP